MSFSRRPFKRTTTILFALLVGLFGAGALGEDLAPGPAPLDLQAMVVGLVLPYIASALGVAACLGVLRWFIPALQKEPGAKKLDARSKLIVRALVTALSFVSAFGGAVPPLGGEVAGIAGRVGAGFLITLLAMVLRDALQNALRRKAGA